MPWVCGCMLMRLNAIASHGRHPWPNNVRREVTARSNRVVDLGREALDGFAPEL